MDYINDSDSLFYGKYCTYKIMKGDTLQSVSRKLDIEVQEIRSYHNKYCQIVDLIEADFKHYSRFLILAPEKKVSNTNEIVEKKQKDVNFGKDYQLIFQPKGLSKNYSVEYTFDVGGKIDTMEMGVRVKWISADSNNYHLFEIHKSTNFFIDDAEPDVIMDDIGFKMSKVLYPLKIVVDASGKWIDIYNYSEIISRWENKKDEIFDYYKNDVLVTQRLVEFIEGALTNSDALFDSLSSDYFLSAFFNGIHISYTANYAIKNEVSLALRKNKDSIFKVEQKINTYVNDDNLIEVEQKGDYINSNTEIDFGYEPYIGKYSAAYYLDSDSFFIEKINLECSIEYDEPIKVSLVIESIKG